MKKSRTRRPNLNADEKKQIVKLRSSGMTFAEIGERLQCAPTAAARACIGVKDLPKRRVMGKRKGTVRKMPSTNGVLAPDHYADAGRLLREALDDILSEFDRNRKFVRAIKDLVAKFNG